MNNFTIIFTESYVRRARKFFKKHPELLSQYEKCLQLMEINPFHPSLRLHPLRGKLTGIYSISLTLSYRLTIEFLIEDKEIIPIQIGTHNEVYS
jgi:mRNA-degrading endonuclease YafQ of YafQ-DinJ toxin-antitoxin module